jgi:methionyl-tRNA formyltransferase
MGTPEFAVPMLAGIIAQRHLVTAVYTRAPKPGGRRGLEPVPSPVHVTARRFGIEVVTPRTLRSGDAVAGLAQSKFLQSDGSQSLKSGQNSKLCTRRLCASAPENEAGL